MPFPPHSSSITDVKRTSPRELGAGRQQRLDGDEVGGDAGLHVAGAAAPDATARRSRRPTDRASSVPPPRQGRRRRGRSGGASGRRPAAQPPGDAACDPRRAGAEDRRAGRQAPPSASGWIRSTSKPEPAQPLLDDALRALLVAEQGALPDEPRGQVVEVVDPFVDGSGDRGEHARIIGRRLGALPPTESRSGAPAHARGPVVERAAASVERLCPT